MDAIRPMGQYLFRLEERMDRTNRSSRDATPGRLARAAGAAIHSLWVGLHH